MKSKPILRLTHSAVICTFLFGVLFLHTGILNSQTAERFIGKWTFDKAKSTSGTNNSDYPGTIIREISQTGSTLSYRDVYTAEGSNPFTTADNIVNLEGKEDIDKSDPNVTLSSSLKWSEDKKSFTITFRTKYIDEGKSKELVLTENYKLSDDGRVLTIQESTKSEMGEFKTTNVYQKK